MTEVVLPDYLEALSDDAKAVGSAWFGAMLPGGDSQLTFHMEQSRPSDRAQAALDELVATGTISAEIFGKKGGMIYRPLKEMRFLMGWMWQRMDDPSTAFALTQKIDPSAPKVSPTMTITLRG